jgi:hypothetical protein
VLLENILMVIIGMRSFTAIIFPISLAIAAMSAISVTATAAGGQPAV